MKIHVLEFSKWNSKFSIFDRSKSFLDQSNWWIKLLYNIGLVRLMLDYCSIKTRKTEFSAEFLITVLNVWKCFMHCEQFYETVLWNILTLHMCLLVKYIAIGINRGLCSLKKKHKIVGYKEIQEILWSFSRITICRTQQLGCILETSLW